MNDTQTSARQRRKKPSKTVALRRAETLLEVSRRCAAANDVVSVLKTLVDITAEALDCDRGTLFLNDAETGEPKATSSVRSASTTPRGSPDMSSRPVLPY